MNHIDIDIFVFYYSNPPIVECVKEKGGKSYFSPHDLPYRLQYLQLVVK